MRHAELIAAEKAADERKQNRAKGFGLMEDRDKSCHYLSNGVMMLWHAPKPVFPDQGMWIAPPGSRVPEDSFILVIDGKEVLFNTEEFRKYLRWA